MRRTRKTKIPESNLVLIVAASALLIGLYFSQQINRPSKPAVTHATLYPDDYRKLVDFELFDQHGQPFTQHNFQNHWSLVFFGFTSCPDVCPTTLTILKQVASQIKNKQTDQPLQVIFITADPERDTQEQLKSYLNYFDPKFIGLSGDSVQLNKLSRYFGAFTIKVENPSGPESYTIDHSASILLLSPQAQPYALFSAPHKTDELIKDLTIITQHHRD